MPLESQDCGDAVCNIISYQSQAENGSKGFGNNNTGGIGVPLAETFISKQFPGKVNVGVNLALWRYIRMTDKIRGGNAISQFQRVEQLQEA